MGSVKYRSRVIDKPLAVDTRLLSGYDCAMRKRASAARDATDLSAEYRGLYGFAHIGVIAAKNSPITWPLRT